MSRPVIYIHRVLWCPYDLYINSENEALLRSFAEVVNHGDREEPVDPDEMAEVLQGVSGILSLNGSGAPEVTEDAIEAAGTVRVAAVSHWWGQHNDVAPLWEGAGVEVIDASDACNEAVAEWALGAAIAGLRKFDEYDRRLKAGEQWPHFGAADQLNGSTVGLVALGRVGRIFTRYLQAFDVRILVYDPYVVQDDLEEQGIHAELVDLETLLSTSDVVSLHAPVTPETRNMIGAHELSLIKDGALFINCARAALVHRRALREELQKGRFRAYLDVFDPEPPAEDDVLRTLDNVVLTPHVAGTTQKMFHRCGRFAIEALQQYFAADKTDVVRV